MSSDEPCGPTRQIPVNATTVVGSMVALVSALGLGSTFGFTVEPITATEMRTELAVCLVQLKIYEDAARSVAPGGG